MKGEERIRQNVKGEKKGEKNDQVKSGEQKEKDYAMGREEIQAIDGLETEGPVQEDAG